MKAFASHATAAYIWNIPHLDAVLGAAADGGRRRPGGGSEDITVTDRRARYPRQGFRVHLCGQEMPRDAVVRVGGQWIASPPLVFLELAGELDIHRTILLGMQMCAHAPGWPGEAVTTVRQLMSLTTRMPLHFGSRKALRALAYVADGSGSLVESVAYMILPLPHLLGGYGLRGAVLNHEVLLGEKARWHLGQNRCFADFFFEREHVAVEYDSLEHHGTAAQQGKDFLRAAALESQGLDVVRFSTIQLYNASACEVVMHNLAARLGRRIRIRTPQFEPAHAQLRALLPRKAALADAPTGAGLNTTDSRRAY